MGVNTRGGKIASAEKFFRQKLLKKVQSAIISVTEYSKKRQQEDIIKIIKAKNNITLIIGRCIMLIY